MSTIEPQVARKLWKALMDNASQLIVDAGLLLQHGSAGRARALAVLAQEELGKALWVYQSFQHSWNVGATEPLAVARLSSHGANHAEKYLHAFVFGNDLELFWGEPEFVGPADGESFNEYFDRGRREAQAAAKDANRDKQRGLYVDFDGEAILTPRDLPEDGIREGLSRAAQVIEMLLIKDHSRMKFDATTPYDGTHEQQWRLMPISHPEDFAEFVERGPGRDDTPGLDAGP